MTIEHSGVQPGLSGGGGRADGGGFHDPDDHEAILLAPLKPDGSPDRLIDARGSASALTGYTREELLERTLEDLAVDPSVVRQRLAPLREAGFVRVHTTFAMKDGRKRPVCLDAHRLEAGGTEPLMLAVCRDRVRERRNELERARLAAIVESSEDAIIGMTLDGIITNWNHGARRLYGYTTEEAIGQPISILVPDERMDELDAIHEAIGRGESLSLYGTRRFCKDGRKLEVAVTTSPIRDRAGRITGASNIVRDITERREMERALQASEERFRTIFELAAVGIAQVDTDGRFILGNQAFCDLLGYEHHELLERTFRDVIHEEDLAREEEPIVRVLRGKQERHAFECRGLRKDGSTIWVKASGSPVRDEHGEVDYTIGIIQDISPRKAAEAAAGPERAEAERRARELQALAAKMTQMEQKERRRMAGLMREHLQELLVAGQMKLEVGRRERGPKAAAYLQEMNEYLQVGIECARWLSVRLCPPVLYEMEFAGVLKWLAGRIEELHGLRVQLDCDPSVDPVEEQTRFLLYRGVMELLYNAAKHAGVKQVRLTLGREGNGWLSVAVEDTGRGFEPAEIEVHAAAKDRWGLFMVRERLSLIGGALRIESAPGKGTRATLLVPLETGPPATALPVPPVSESFGASPISAIPGADPAEAERAIRVVLAEDQPLIRRGLRSALSVWPDILIVGEAADGQQAIDAVRRLRPDIVALDATMPRISGLEAVRRIRAEFPEMGIIGLATREDRDMARAVREAGANEFLPKAATPETLATACRKACDRRLG